LKAGMVELESLRLEQINELALAGFLFLVVDKWLETN
jgi:hypothetical protein